MNQEKKGHGAGYLTLANGQVFAGTLHGAPLDAYGEVVFHTGMTGYQEVMTDPSFAGQIVTFTYPLIGNYGINEWDNEALAPALAGMVVSELCEEPSHYQSTATLGEIAERFGFPILAGVDTRSITKLVRTQGDIYGIIADRPLSTAEVAQYQAGHEQLRKSLVAKVSPQKAETYPGNGEHVVLVDLGMKRSILQSLLDAGCRVTVVPYNTTYTQIQALEPDGIVFSNGPGDPADLLPYCAEWRKTAESYPTLGICLGHQIVALMYQAVTEKLLFGHRGSNHPVKDLTTGKVYMTSQNHGYVVKEETIDKRLLAVTYRNVNDKSVEGLRHLYLPIMSVQFHPEAHPGPDDTSHIFQQFIQSMRTIGAKHYA